MSPAPTTAFSLLTPLQRAFALLRGRPGLLVLAVVVSLVPVAVLAEGLAWQLREGGATALESWRDGASPSTGSAIVTEPAGGDTTRLLVLGALLTACCAAIAAGGATAASAAHRPLRQALGAWPVYFIGFLVQLLVAAVLLGVTLALADWAGNLRFQLADVVTVVGVLAIVTLLARTALWPVFAADGRGILAALAASWRQTAADPLRATVAAVLVPAAVFLPAFALSAGVRAVLGALERSERLAWSPQTIDLLALAPWAVALPAASALVAVGVASLAGALAAHEQRRLSDAAAALPA